MRTQVSQNLEKVSWLALQKSNYHWKSDFPTMTFCLKKCHGCVITMTFKWSTMTFLKYQIYTFGPSKNLTFSDSHWSTQPYALPTGLYYTAAEYWFYQLPTKIAFTGPYKIDQTMTLFQDFENFCSHNGTIMRG